MAAPTRVTLDPGDHVAFFYAGDAGLAATVGVHLAEGLVAGDVAVVIATPAHRTAFESVLAAEGIDVAGARAAGRLLEMDAVETLARITVDGEPDHAAFEAAVGEVMRRAEKSGRRVRAYGELVALLWEAGHVEGAIRIEEFWNGLAAGLPFSLFCAYPIDPLAPDDRAGSIPHVCAVHSHVVGSPPDPGTEARERFGGTPREARRARRFILGTLRAWRREELVDDAMLIGAELASNAVLHARSDFEVVVTRRPDGGVRIAVEDGSTVRPAPRAPDVPTPGGRGLALVEVLASRWSHEIIPSGKRVWADLAPPGPSAA